MIQQLQCTLNMLLTLNRVPFFPIQRHTLWTQNIAFQGGPFIEQLDYSRKIGTKNDLSHPQTLMSSSNFKF